MYPPNLAPSSNDLPKVVVDFLLCGSQGIPHKHGYRHGADSAGHRGDVTGYLGHAWTRRGEEGTSLWSV